MLSRIRTSVHVLQKWLLAYADYGLRRRVYISGPRWKDERDPLLSIVEMLLLNSRGARDSKIEKKWPESSRILDYILS